MKKKQKSFGATIMDHLDLLQEEKDKDKDDDDTSKDKDDEDKEDTTDDDKSEEDEDKKVVKEEDDKKDDDDDSDDKDSDDDDDEDEDDDDDDKKKVDEEAKPDFDKDAEEVDDEEGVDEVDDAADAVKTKAKRGGAAGASAKDDQTQEKADKAVQEEWLNEFNRLCNEEANLSIDFQKKAAKIFKQAVAGRVKKVASEEALMAEQNFEEQISTVAEEIEHDTIQSVGKFLDYAVEEWIKKNEMPIKTSLRSHMMEQFIDELHTLFTDHYIEVPESKVNVLEDLEKKNKKLEKQLNEEKAALERKLSKNENELRKLQKDFDKVLQEQQHLEKEAIIAEECEGLTITQQEHIKDLMEESYDIPLADFSRKLEKAKRVLTKEQQTRTKRTNANSNILGDSYNDITISEGKDENKPKKSNSGTINKYVDHLSRMSKYDVRLTQNDK